MEKLQQARADLKAHFLGIDDIIDNVIDLMTFWYTNPEAIDRPVIINLWGMTGTGKTDFVRRLASALELPFEEKQMCSTAYGAISDEIPTGRGVLLIDEFQRWAHKDEAGNRKDVPGYQDLWMILSDGKVSISIEETKREFLRSVLRHRRREQNASPTTKKVLDPSPVIAREGDDGFWNSQALWLIRRLSPSVSYEDAMFLSEEESEALCFKIIAEVSAAPVRDFSKYLIFICGNLDGLYEFSDHVSEQDLPADYIHDCSKRLTASSAKIQLGKIFFPEQVARLGSNHMIYKALSSSAYEALIRRRIQFHVDRIKEKTGKSFTPTDDLIDFIYRNGVFPVQGVRPLYSYIDGIMFTSVLPLAYEQASGGVIDYVEGRIIVGDMSRPLVGDRDALWASHPKDVLESSCIHEMGHAAIVYGITGQWPDYILVNPSGGATIHSKSLSLMEDAAISCAGIAAEDMFGFKTYTGHSSDLQRFTYSIVTYARFCGGGSYFGHFVPESLDMARSNFLTTPALESELTLISKRVRSLVRNYLELPEVRSAIIYLSKKLRAEKVLKGSDISITLPKLEVDHPSHYVKSLDDLT